MNTTDQVLLIIVTVLLSIFVICGIAVLVGAIKLISVIRGLVVKAEEVVDSAESAVEIFKDTQGSMAIFKLVRNIIKVANGSNSKKGKK